jgi:signal transduction histidine kinase
LRAPLGENEGMIERRVETWLGAVLAPAAFGQAAWQAATLRFSGWVPGVPALLYAVPLCALALLSTLPLLPLPIRWQPRLAAVVTVGATAVALAVFSALTAAGALATVIAVWRLGAAGSHGSRVRGRAGGWLRRERGGPVGAAANYLATVDLAGFLAVGLAVPFLVLALARHGDVTCLLLAWGVPTAAGAGIALRAQRTARTYSEAGEALADTLVAHTARGERARIARELHDVVAHHVSVIAVLAETGRLATPGLPETGARRFAEIGDTARAGLTEMRRLLGVLREDAAAAAPEQLAAPAPEAAREPQPGLAQLTGLIDAAREASLAGTRLIISGPVAPLDPGVELAAYRIVQEALTNARRHAPGAAVDVELRYGAQALRVRVRDNGPGPVAADAAGLTPGEAAGSPPRTQQPGGELPGGARPGGRHGLLGMRERALSVGGALYAGAAPVGGFLVEAVLPSEPDPVRAARTAGPATADDAASPSQTDTVGTARTAGAAAAGEAALPSEPEAVRAARTAGAAAADGAETGNAGAGATGAGATGAGATGAGATDTTSTGGKR